MFTTLDYLERLPPTKITKGSTFYTLALRAFSLCPYDWQRWLFIRSEVSNWFRTGKEIGNNTSYFPRERVMRLDDERVHGLFISHELINMCSRFRLVHYGSGAWDIKKARRITSLMRIWLVQKSCIEVHELFTNHGFDSKGGYFLR